MTKFAVFETAGLADAIGKASRIAPSKGAAFDKSAGINIDLDPDMPHRAIVRAYDLEVYYREEVTVLEAGDEAASWRLPASLFAGVTANLPIGSGRTVRMAQEGNGVTLDSGKINARLNTMAQAFPDWQPFDEEDLQPAADLSTKFKQVVWACDKSSIPLTGVHIDGEHLIATDRYKVAWVDCEVPVAKPVTVPLRTLTQAIKSSVEMKVASEERRLLLMPDPYTKIYTTIYDANYPMVSKIFRDDFTVTSEFDKQEMLDAISRMMVLVKTERYPRLTLRFHDEVCRLKMEMPELGEMEDEIDCDTTGGDYVIHYTPENFVDALNAAPKQRVRLSMGEEPHRNTKVEVADGSESYQAWVMPRREAEGEA